MLEDLNLFEDFDSQVYLLWRVIFRQSTSCSLKFRLFLKNTVNKATPSNKWVCFNAAVA